MDLQDWELLPQQDCVDHQGNKETTPTQINQEIKSFNQDTTFFNKITETDQFGDLKRDPPNSTRGGAHVFQFDEDGEYYKESEADSELVSTKIDMESSKSVGRSLNLWKWSLSGIGAISSFGVAAASVCIIILSCHKKNKHPHHNQNFQFQVYTNDKRNEQVVQHPGKVDEASSVLRGGPIITRARITFGGYYDAAL